LRQAGILNFAPFLAQISMSHLDNRQRWAGHRGILLTLLLARFSLRSLNVPFDRRVVLLCRIEFHYRGVPGVGLILAAPRCGFGSNAAENSSGARFKTRLVVGAMAISLLPSIFMFIVSYSLINRVYAVVPQTSRDCSEERRSS